MKSGMFSSSPLFRWQVDPTANSSLAISMRFLKVTFARSVGCPVGVDRDNDSVYHSVRERLGGTFVWTELVVIRHRELDISTNLPSRAVHFHSSFLTSLSLSLPLTPPPSTFFSSDNRLSIFRLIDYD